MDNLTQTERETMDAAMEALGRKHGFHAVSVGFNTEVSVGRWWTASVHWDGFSRTGIECASGSGNTPLEALAAVEAEAVERRQPWSDDGKASRIKRLQDELATLTGGSA